METILLFPIYPACIFTISLCIATRLLERSHGRGCLQHMTTLENMPLAGEIEINPRDRWEQVKTQPHLSSRACIRSVTMLFSPSDHRSAFHFDSLLPATESCFPLPLCFVQKTITHGKWLLDGSRKKGHFFSEKYFSFFSHSLSFVTDAISPNVRDASVAEIFWRDLCMFRWKRRDYTWKEDAGTKHRATQQTICAAESFHVAEWRFFSCIREDLLPRVITRHYFYLVYCAAILFEEHRNTAYTEIAEFLFSSKARANKKTLRTAVI